MTRWELMKEAWKGREPVSTSEIVSGIRAGTIKALQPAVRAGEQFREAHPAAAQRISIVVREPPKVYRRTEERVAAKIPTLQNISQMGAKFRQSNPVAANRLYTTFQKAHTQTQRVGTIEQRNALAGYTYGSYQSLQRQPVKTAAMFAVGMGSGKALSVIGRIGKAYGAGAKTARVAQAAQLGIVGLYGKQSVDHIMSAPNSYVAGQRAAKIVYTELLPMAVGVKVAEVAPKVARKAVVTAKTVKPTIQKQLTSTIKGIEAKRDTIINKIKIGKRKGTLSKSEIVKMNDQVRMYNGRIRTKRKELLNIRRDIRAKLTEFELKQRALEGKSTLTNSEMDTLVSSFKPREFGIKKMPVKTVSKFNKLKQDIKYLVPRIKELKFKITRGKGISEKQLTKLQSDLKLSDARLISKRKELLSIRKQIRSKLTDIELKQKALEAEEYIPLTDANMKTMLDLFKPIKKPKIKDVAKEFRAETAKKEAAVKRGELLEIQQKDGTIALQKVVQKQKQVVKTVAKVKNEVKTATKTVQKVKAEVRTATELKIKTKVQQKTKLRSLKVLRTTAQANVKTLTNMLTQLKVATTEMQKIETAPKTKKKIVAPMATAMKTKAKTLTELDTLKITTTKAIAEQKAAAKELIRAIRAVEALKLKVPPIVPKMKIPTKKKITKKRREVMILKQKNLNAVATFRDLLGGL